MCKTNWCAPHIILRLQRIWLISFGRACRAHEVRRNYLKWNKLQKGFFHSISCPRRHFSARVCARLLLFRFPARTRMVLPLTIFASLLFRSTRALENYGTERRAQKALAGRSAVRFGRGRARELFQHCCGLSNNWIVFYLWLLWGDFMKRNNVQFSAFSCDRISIRWSKN